MKALRTIILAAGKGTRMKSSLPKVLHKVCGRPMIQYVVDTAIGIGSSKTYVVLGHKLKAVENCLDGGVICVEQKKLLGTADAVRTCENYFRSYNGEILIMCGDAPLLSKSTIRSLIRRHKRSNSVCTFLTTVLHDPQGYGRVIRDGSGDVQLIREDKDAIGFERDIAEINVGVYCVAAKELFKVLREIKVNKKKGEFYLTDIIESFSQKGLKVDSLEVEDPHEGRGINTREDLAVVERQMRHKIARNFMLSGVSIIDPQTTYIDAGVKIGRDTEIYPFTYIEGDVSIGEKCRIGPFARLRPGTKIGNCAEVGNFTEVSRTKIGDNSFMKHFGFLGDAILGKGVNIGAGTVTANYNGIEKNQTKILDQAFIGSNSVFVAPVKIGKKAVVGAGSVVTKGKNIPDGGVALGVPAKINTGRKRK